MPLAATKLYLHGISVDQEFRTEYLTRLTDSAALRRHDVRRPAAVLPGGLVLGGWPGREPARHGRLGSFKPYADRLARGRRRRGAGVVDRTDPRPTGRRGRRVAVTAIVAGLRIARTVRRGHRCCCSAPALVLAWGGLYRPGRTEPAAGARWSGPGCSSASPPPSTPSTWARGVRDHADGRARRRARGYAPDGTWRAALGPAVRLVVIGADRRAHRADRVAAVSAERAHRSARELGHRDALPARFGRALPAADAPLLAARRTVPARHAVAGRPRVDVAAGAGARRSVSWRSTCGRCCRWRSPRSATRCCPSGSSRCCASCSARQAFSDSSTSRGWTVPRRPREPAGPGRGRR